MLLEIINKLFTVVFFMAALNSIRHGYYFVQTLIISRRADNDDEVLKYKLSGKSLLLLGVSVAYLLTVLFTGIKI